MSSQKAFKSAEPKWVTYRLKWSPTLNNKIDRLNASYRQIIWLKPEC